MHENTIGTLAWFDLTVPNAPEVRDFYSNVIGWKPKPVSMGDYDDYSMQLPDTEEDVAGVCHSKGPNADMPAQWMLYFLVEDLEASLQQVVEQGGEQVTPVKSFGPSRYAVVKDPAGAVCALYQDND